MAIEEVPTSGLETTEPGGARADQMRILVTNDDGMFSPGLWELVRELSALGEVWAVVPDRELSGQGTAVTYLHPLQVHKMESPPVPDIQGYAVQGTPSDCVILALEKLVPDAACVVSGINAGANLGDDILLSGTVAGALQGYYRGLPSFAISLTGMREPRFQAAARLAGLLVQQVAEGALGAPLCLNANVPNVTWEELRGIEVTRLGRRTYADKVEEAKDAWGRPQYWLRRGSPQWQVEEGTDIWAIQQQRISLTPLSSDLTLVSPPSGLQEFQEQVRPLLTPPELLPPFEPGWPRRPGRPAGSEEGEERAGEQPS